MSNSIRTERMEQELQRYIVEGLVPDYVAGMVYEGREVWCYCPHCRLRSPVVLNYIDVITCTKCSHKHIGWR